MLTVFPIPTKYLQEEGVAERRQREKELTALFHDLLRPLLSPKLRLIGPDDPERKVGVISLDFCEKDNAEIAFALENDYGILTRCGLHCAPSAHRTYGTFPGGTVRFSLGNTTTPEEIEATVRAIKALLE